MSLYLCIIVLHTLAFAVKKSIQKGPSTLTQASNDAPIFANGTVLEKQLGKSTFSVMRKRVTQAEARAMCEKRGATYRLAVLPTLKDAQELSQEIYKISVPYSEAEYEKKNHTNEWGLDRRYWIGLVDLLEEGAWEWMNANGLYLNYDFWYPGQPDHLKPKKVIMEHCVTLWNPIYYKNESHTFNDENCNNKHYFICENNAQKGKQTGRAISGGVVFHDDHDTNTSLPLGVMVLENVELEKYNRHIESTESEEGSHSNEESWEAFQHGLEWKNGEERHLKNDSGSVENDNDGSHTKQESGREEHFHQVVKGHHRRHHQNDSDLHQHPTPEEQLRSK